jgi:two-component system chemotaxis response regulator CheY
VNSSPPFSVQAALRIFCVDDDPASQRSIIAALARPGWAVECACDGCDALEQIARHGHGFDLLVTDHQMPRVDGLGLVGALRSRGYAGPVIVVTAGLTPVDRAAYAALGAGLVLPKPIDSAHLRKVVEAVAVIRPQSAHPFITTSPTSLS